jgi:hypothetical protein
VTQFLIEEAAAIYYDAVATAEMEAEQPAPRPGEITDPVMQQAMAEAKRLHFEATGVRV